MAVNMEVAIPIAVVMAKPLIEPVPTAYKMVAVITVVKFASKILENAPL